MQIWRREADNFESVYAGFEKQLARKDAKLEARKRRRLISRQLWRRRTPVLRQLWKRRTPILRQLWKRRSSSSSV
jgi:hypothetical protein